MPQCFLVSEIAVGVDESGRQISSDVSICGVFTSSKMANNAVLTWHERDYVPVGLGDFESYKLSKPDGLLHLTACALRQSWEVSIEMIEMNMEFTMSLLDPVLPEEVETPETGESKFPIASMGPTAPAGPRRGRPPGSGKSKPGMGRLAKRPKVEAEEEDASKGSTPIPAKKRGRPRIHPVAATEAKGPQAPRSPRGTKTPTQSPGTVNASPRRTALNAKHGRSLTSDDLADLVDKKSRSPPKKRNFEAKTASQSGSDLGEDEKKELEEKRRQKIHKELKQLGIEQPADKLWLRRILNGS